MLNTLPYDQEIIFVDDGSSDDSATMLSHIAAEDKDVKVLLLARNFGHQLALTCGLDYSTGDAVITMDGDMQHPPELIPELVRLWEEGHDVVRTIRDSTEDAGWAKSFTSKYYYKLMNIMANVPIVEGGSDFRLMNRRALDTLLRFREHGRFLRGIVGAIGYNQAEIHFVAPPRFAGKIQVQCCAKIVALCLGRHCGFLKSTAKGRFLYRSDLRLIELAHDFAYSICAFLHRLRCERLGYFGRCYFLLRWCATRRYRYYR